MHRVALNPPSGVYAASVLERHVCSECHKLTGSLNLAVLVVRARQLPDISKRTGEASAFLKDERSENVTLDHTGSGCLQ